MSGVLIYTASGDADGTLGCLVAQGEPARLPRVIAEALRRSTWCSNDPVCMEGGERAPDSGSLAACHSCSLVPETSCEHGNKPDRCQHSDISRQISCSEKKLAWVSTKTREDHEVPSRLRGEILEGAIPPGQRLGMAELTARYGVGLNPLREALSRLAGEGIVEMESQRGFRAAPMSREDFAELLFLRRLIEEAGVRSAVANGDDQWEASVVAALHLLERRVQTVNEAPTPAALQQYEIAHKGFHTALIAGAGSRRLSLLHLRLYDEARRYRLEFYRRRYTQQSVMDAVIAEHRRILEAVLSRDGDCAAAALSSHVSFLSDFDLSVVEEPVSSANSGLGLECSPTTPRRSRAASKTNTSQG